MAKFIVITTANGETLEKFITYLFDSQDYPCVAQVTLQSFIVLSIKDADEIRADLSKTLGDKDTLYVFKLANKGISAMHISLELKRWLERMSDPDLKIEDIMNTEAS